MVLKVKPGAGSGVTLGKGTRVGVTVVFVSCVSVMFGRVVTVTVDMLGAGVTDMSGVTEALGDGVMLVLVLLLLWLMPGTEVTNGFGVPLRSGKGVAPTGSTLVGVYTPYPYLMPSLMMPRPSSPSEF